MSLNIAILGAGIGGPAASITLSKFRTNQPPHTITIYEKYPTTTDNVGYAFRITPNSDLCLYTLGIDTTADGAVPSNIGNMYLANGQHIGQFGENVDVKPEDRGVKGTGVFVFRPKLHDALIVQAGGGGGHSD